MMSRICLDSSQLSLAVATRDAQHQATIYCNLSAWLFASHPWFSIPVDESTNDW